MEAVSLKNSSGHVIEVKLGPKGEILARHSDLYPEGFGWITSLGNLSHKRPKQWDPVAEQCLYSDGEYEEAIGKLKQIPVLCTRTEELFIDEEDLALIESAVRQFDLNPDS